MRITHCLLCQHWAPALTMSSYLTPLTNSNGAALFEPIRGEEAYCASDPFNPPRLDKK